MCVGSLTGGEWKNTHHHALSEWVGYCVPMFLILKETALALGHTAEFEYVHLNDLAFHPHADRTHQTLTGRDDLGVRSGPTPTSLPRRERPT